MKHAHRLWFAAPVLFATLAGCGQRVVRYPVEGVVTLDGKPVEGASVAFMPKAKGCLGVAATDAEGRFALKEMDRYEGVMPGEYRVAVFLAEYSEAKRRRVPRGTDGDEAQTATIEIVESEPRIVRYVVPQRYGKAETSGLQCEVTGPTKGLTLALTSQ